VSKRVLTAVLAFVAVAVGVVTVVLARDTEPAVTREELLLYQAEIYPPLANGGRTVEQGMKPAVPDVRAGKVAASEAEGWVMSLRAVREEVLLVDVPPGLRDAAGLFATALDKYVEAAETFQQAAGAGAAERDTLVDAAVALAEEADRAYDDASRVIQQWRRRLGLGPSAQFPDPTAPSRP